jgi:pimeloyl-ACP methyl ester carboxylesterase
MAVGAYGLLLGVSFIVRTTRSPVMNVTNVGPFDRLAVVQAVDGPRLTADGVRFVYRDYATGSSRAAPTIVLLHRSPGHMDDFAGLAPSLAQRARVVVPDLPGFGSSTQRLPDYSFRAHAVYVRQLLDQLGIQRAHILGYSMGGGVALSFSDLAADRITSLTMLSAIGVQGMELTGDYAINHFVHGAQLAAIWLAREGTPHMGRFDDLMLSVPYARNFFDSDQRPLRDTLRRVNAPTLIVHGLDDGQVPIEAAREHARLVPQSELHVLNGDHFLLFTNASEIGGLVAGFIDRVERGQALQRANANPERLRAASPAAVSDRLPLARGIAAATFGGLLTSLTALSGSLGGAAAGVLVARGRISFALAVRACFIGAFLLNLLLFLTVRHSSRRILQIAPIRWLFPPSDVDRTMAWLLTTRGQFRAMWSPTLHERRRTTAATALARVGIGPFLVSLLLETMVWSIVAVSIAASVTFALFAIAPRSGLLSSVRTPTGVGVAVLALNVLPRTATRRERRLLVSSWRRFTTWEFWPPWVFYPPLIVYIGYLAAKHRSATVFTAANPAILAGGFVGESKYGILQGLGGSPEYVARSRLIAGNLSSTAKLAEAQTFMECEALTFPIILKPNEGQRGSGVVIVRSAEALQHLLTRSSVDTIVQEYVLGFEFGVFYYRYPSESRGLIFSVTEKKFPTVVGDGQRTLEDLILNDDRAVCAVRLYCDRHRDQLSDVPAVGQSIPLVELGTHCRGAMFLDGGWVLTPALVDRFDEIGRAFHGFYFGRFDVRVTGDIEVFRQGRGFKIIELNGVTSEATHIYHPGTPLLTAYRVLMNQWRIAFEIGAENRRRGVAPTSVSTLLRLTREYRHNATRHLSERSDTDPSPSALDASEQPA